jgi:hypothetical protein
MACFELGIPHRVIVSAATPSRWLRMIGAG